MPGRDGTGPMGAGEMTGRGLGVCAGANTSVYGAGRGCGFARGRGAGRGFSNRRFGNSQDLAMQGMGANDMGVLKTEKEMLLKRVELIDKQLDGVLKETK